MAGSKYDVIVIGGGHNGLVNSAYLARAGKKVLVLERRHVLGGAACTEEIVPGFKFSVCSYVVSLLRPEIIRDLDLPRHGLEILPLDGTFTPMPSGDYLWQSYAGHVPFRETDSQHGTAGSNNPESTRTDEIALHRTQVPGHVELRQVQPGAAHDDVGH
jgi:phytoene dehydrogenase-like protein